MKLRFLSAADLSIVFAAAVKRLNENGPDYYGWKNSPEFDGVNFTHKSGWGEDEKNTIVGPTEALRIYEEKLNGAYGERFLCSLGMIAGLVTRGKRVAILQKAEKGLPFNAEGWVILCIEGYPMFHVAPWDLTMSDIESITNLVLEGTEEWQWTEWKGTDKVSEYTMLLEWLAE